MNRLHIHFDQHTVEILELPETPVKLAAVAKTKPGLLFKSADGKLFFHRGRWKDVKGVVITRWDSDYGLDWLPALHRLGCLPKGYTIQEARRRVRAADVAAERAYRIRRLHDICRALKIKAPRVK